VLDDDIISGDESVFGGYAPMTRVLTARITPAGDSTALLVELSPLPEMLTAERITAQETR
jgi:hypothetical protein